MRYTRQRGSSLWRDRGDQSSRKTSFWLHGSNTVEPPTQYNRKQSSRDDLIMQKLRSSKVLHGSLSTSWRPPAASQIASASQPPRRGATARHWIWETHDISVARPSEKVQDLGLAAKSKLQSGSPKQLCAEGESRHENLSIGNGGRPFPICFSSQLSPRSSARRRAGRLGAPICPSL